MSKIIIDGVNVAGCKHLWKDNSVIDLNFCRINFDNNYFSNGIPCCDKCNKHPDCYFKQLQRKTKECENAIHNWQFSEKLYSEIKTELEQYKKSKQASYESMQTEWNKAVNELRDVKAEMQEKVLKMAEAEVEIEKLQTENERLKAEVEDLNFYIDSYRLVWEIDKYRNALEEINLILCEGRTFYDGYFDTDNLSRTDKAIKLINEVLNEAKREE